MSIMQSSESPYKPALDVSFSPSFSDRSAHRDCDPRASLDFITSRSTSRDSNAHSPSLSPQYRLSTMDRSSISSISYDDSRRSSSGYYASSRSSWSEAPQSDSRSSITLPSCRSLIEDVDKTTTVMSPTARHEQPAITAPTPTEPLRNDYQPSTFRQSLPPASHMAQNQSESYRHSYPAPHSHQALVAVGHPHGHHPQHQHQHQHHYMADATGYQPPFLDPRYRPQSLGQRRKQKESKPRFNKEYTAEQIHFCLYTFIDKKLNWSETLERYRKLFPGDRNRGTAGLQGVMYRENKVFPRLKPNGDLMYNHSTESFETVVFPIRSQGDKIGLLDRYPDAAISYPWVDEIDKARVWERGMRHKEQRQKAEARKRMMKSLPSPVHSPGSI